MHHRYFVVTLTMSRYVSTQIQNNPTYEFFPKKGAAVNLQFLTDTVPLNLFPLTWLLPSGTSRDVA